MRFNKESRQSSSDGSDDSSHLISFRHSVNPELHDMSHAPLAKRDCEWCRGEGYVYGICIPMHGMKRFRTSVEFIDLEFLNPRYSYAKFKDVMNQLYVNPVMCPCKWPKHKAIIGLHFQHPQDADMWMAKQRELANAQNIEAMTSKPNKCGDSPNQTRISSILSNVIDNINV